MGTNFKIYDYSLIQNPSSGLPLTGGTMTGNLIMQTPFRFSQCQTPIVDCDLTNKAYVDAQIRNFLPLTGGTMSGVLKQPIAPINSQDVANKAYVDAQIGGGVQDATTDIKGKIRLDGDLTGTSDAPTVKPLAITNSKLADLSGNSRLKGSSSTTTTAADITLGTGLIMDGLSLNVDPATIQKAGLTQFGVVKFDTTSGDLNETAPNSGIGVIKPLAVTNSKVAPGLPNTLKGTNSTIVVDDIILGPGLFLSTGVISPTLSLDFTTAPKAGLTQFGVVKFDTTSGDLNETAPNSGIGVIKPLAVTNSKLANLSGNSRLKGSSSTTATAADITLGTGLIMNGLNLNVDTAALGGPFLAIAGGTMTGNVLFNSPAKVQQTEAPTTGNDLTNKTFTDSSYQSKQNSSILDHIAIFGDGVNQGQTIDSGYVIDTNLLNPPSNLSLWSISRTVGVFQYGAEIFISNASLGISGNSQKKAFSAQTNINDPITNEKLGPTSWPSIGSTFDIEVDGLVTISNSIQYTTYYKIIFSANSMKDDNGGYGELECQIVHKDAMNNLIPVGLIKTLKVLASPSNFCNEIYLTLLVSVDPNTNYKFFVTLTNNNATGVHIDPEAADRKNQSYLIIERVA